MSLRAERWAIQVVDFDDSPAEFAEPVTEHVVQDVLEDETAAPVTAETTEVFTVVEPTTTSTDVPVDQAADADTVVETTTVQDEAGNTATVMLPVRPCCLLSRLGNCWQ